MLPGFRFLFTAIMLSLSLFIFGLGATSLFRAAHESFANNSFWRGAPEVPFAQRPETVPVLATLSVEPTPDGTNDPIRATAPAEVTATPAEPATPPAEPAVNDQLAALKPAESQPVEEPAKTDSVAIDAPAAQNPQPPETAATSAPAEPAVAPTTNDEIKTATIATPQAAPAENVAAIVPNEPASAPAATVADPVTVPALSPAAKKIATLGGPPVEIASGKPVKDTKVAKRETKQDRSEVRRREHAHRVAQRRRASARARLAAQQYQQQQANPFGQ